MIDRVQEECNTIPAGLKVESSALTRYYCQDAQGKHASMKGLTFFCCFLLVRHLLSDKICISIFILIHSL